MTGGNPVAMVSCSCCVCVETLHTFVDCCALMGRGVYVHMRNVALQNVVNRLFQPPEHLHTAQVMHMKCLVFKHCSILHSQSILYQNIQT